TCPLALRTVLALEDDDVVVRLHDQTEEARMGAHLVADAELAPEPEMLLLRLALTAGHPQQGQHHHGEDEQEREESIHGVPFGGRREHGAPARGVAAADDCPPHCTRRCPSADPGSA